MTQPNRPDRVVWTQPAWPPEDDGLRLVQQQDKWGRLIYYSNGSPVLVPPNESMPGRDRAAWAIWCVFWIQVATAAVVLIALSGGL